ncbi:MAG: TonB-dependent receptor [Gammaproteobacteria bacterium]|nr:TonB-dependent receptor [Gammaproteobacteria bacterium]
MRFFLVTQNTPPDDPVIVEDVGVRKLMQDSKVWHAYLQDIWTITPEWELTAGVRYDDFSNVGSTVNPRLAVVWQTRPNLTGKLLYGRAFRAPSIIELYDPNPVGGQIGNPDAQPETIDWLELAFDHKTAENLHLALNLFTYEWDSLVLAPITAGEALLHADNAGTRKGHGLEFEARWKMTAKSSLLMNYAYQESMDEEADHDAGFAPHHQVYARTDWLFAPDWFLNVQANWVADRERILGDDRPQADDYVALDMTVRRKNKNSPWNFALGARNLFDEDVREPSPGINYPKDFPQAGRSFWAEVRYKFN